MASLASLSLLLFVCSHGSSVPLVLVLQGLLLRTLLQSVGVLLPHRCVLAARVGDELMLGIDLFQFVGQVAVAAGSDCLVGDPYE